MTRLVAVMLGGSVLLSLGCDDGGTSTGSTSATETAAASAPAVAAPVAAVDQGPPKVDFQEVDFTETERSRDPFRSFAKAFAQEAKTKVRSQREVLLNQYAIDELRLIGIVTRLQPDRAMLEDPTGMGHVVSRGQYVGRAEVVEGSGADYEINWRVDRVRDNDIVLIREDPANPDVPSQTRVIPLHTEDVLSVE